MKASQGHREYLGRDFRVTPKKLFDRDELRILETYGHWMMALMQGSIEPETEAQTRFVEVCKGSRAPTTPYEKTWMKYVDRKKWERENPGLVGASGVREADPGWAGYYKAENQNGGYLLSRKRFED